MSATSLTSSDSGATPAPHVIRPADRVPMPQKVGYGLGASSGFVSTLIGLYVIMLLVGAMLLPPLAGRYGARENLV